MVFPVLGALTAFGTAAQGVSSLAGAFGGSRQDPGAPTGSDYLSLYASQLAPGNTKLTLAAQELASIMGPYVQALNTQTALGASQALGQFNQTFYKNQKVTDLLSGIAGGYANAVIGNEDLAAKYKTATEFLGPSTAADLTSTYAQTVSALQNNVLQGESSALNKVTEGQVLSGINASEQRNKLASDIASTNLDIRKRQEDTKNALAIQRGQVEGQLALKRFGAGMAMAGARAFA